MDSITLNFNEKLIKSLPIPMVVVDSNLKVIIINQGFKNIFSSYKTVLRRGLYLEKILKNNFEMFERIKSLIVEDLEKSKFVYVLEDQYYLISINRLINQNQKIYVIMFNNITKQEEIEQIRRKFISNVAHELRTPLSAISAYAELIAYHEDFNEKEVKKSAEVIYTEVQRLSKMVSELMDISKYDNDQINISKEVFNIAKLIDNLKQFYFAKKTSIIINFKCVDCEIYGDFDRLKQLIINLLENALVHARSKVEVDVSIKGTKIRLSVLDDGQGLTIEQKSKVFNRFYRTDESRNRINGGTGLGLSIVKEIVHLHNGNVFVQGEVDKGAEFIVELPIRS